MKSDKIGKLIKSEIST